MERNVSVPLYGAAFLISLAIFLVGIFVGSLVDSNSMGAISGEVSDISEHLASVRLIMLTQGNSSEFCPVYESELEAIDGEVEKVGYRLSFMEDERGVYDTELKKKYFTIEAESYLLSEKVRELCGGNEILLIHFYSNRECARCREQGTEVLKARDALKADGVDVKLFSFDGELGSPVAEAFEKRYGVSAYPSIVIDGKTYAGFRTSEELQALIAAAST